MSDPYPVEVGLGVYDRAGIQCLAMNIGAAATVPIFTTPQTSAFNILSFRVIFALLSITVAFTALTTISVGKTGALTQLFNAVDATTPGLYHILLPEQPVWTTADGGLPVIVTIAGAVPVAGAAVLNVFYSLSPLLGSS
jgi:hypothetical protein